MGNGIVGALQGQGALYGGYAATPAAEAELLARKFNPFWYLLSGQDMPSVEDAPQGYAGGGIVDAIRLIEQRGRGGDTMLAHVNPREAAVLRAMGGSGRINPRTGLREFEDGGEGGGNDGGGSSGGGMGGSGGQGEGGMGSAGGGATGSGNAGGTTGADTGNQGNGGYGGEGGFGAVGGGQAATGGGCGPGQETGQTGGAGQGSSTGSLGAGVVGVGQAALPDPTQNMSAAQMGGKAALGALGAMGVPGLGMVGGMLGNALGLGHTSQAANMGASIGGTLGGIAGGPLGAALGAVAGATAAEHGASGPGLGGGAQSNAGVGIGNAADALGSTDRSSGDSDTQRRQRSLQDLLMALTPKVLGFAGGGIVGGLQRGSHVGMHRFMKGSGLIPGAGPGRSDAIDMKVPSGAYVVPSDVVSGLGEGNSLAGGKRLAKMMPPADAPAFASGGIAGGPGLVDIRISPGEFLVHPQHVDALGGPEVLDRMIQNVRAANARVAEGLPGPR